MLHELDQDFGRPTAIGQLKNKPSISNDLKQFHWERIFKIWFIISEWKRITEPTVTSAKQTTEFIYFLFIFLYIFIYLFQWVFFYAVLKIIYRYRFKVFTRRVNAEPSWLQWLSCGFLSIVFTSKLEFLEYNCCMLLTVSG